MTFEYLIDPAQGPRWKGLLPGSPDAFFLSRGEGEHAKLFGDLFTVLLSGHETDGQFGIITSQSPAGDIIPTHAHADTHETFYVLDGQVRVFVQDREGQKTSRLLGPGDFGFVPAGLTHAYRVEQAARMLGVLSGGFERFFQQMGTPADSGDPEQPPFIPDFPRKPAAGDIRHTQLHKIFDSPETRATRERI